MKLRLKYGLQMLFRNPMRIAASFLTAIAALGIAGMCVFLANYNSLAWERELFFDHSDDKYVCIGSNGGYTLLDPGSLSAEHLAEFQQIGCEYALDVGCNTGLMDESEYLYGTYRLGDYLNGTGIGLYGEYQGETLFAPLAATPYGLSSGGGGDNVTIYNNFYRRLTVYSSEDAIKGFGYELVGKLPEKKNEVAIPQWLYNSFLCYGYKSTDGTVYEINSEADIIGKTIALTDRNVSVRDKGSGYTVTESVPVTFDATIVGVVRTDLEEEQFVERYVWTETVQGEQTYMGFLYGGYSFPPYIGVIISQEYLDCYDERFYGAEDFHSDRNVSVHAITLRRGDYADEVFRFLTDWQNDETFWYYMTVGIKEYHPAYQHSLAEEDLFGALSMVYSEVRMYFQIVPYLGVFAAILLMYLCFSTVMGKRRGVGIMQSMGASKWHMILTIGVPILLFCLLCSLGALGIEFAFMAQMNAGFEADAASRGIVVSQFYPFTLGWETWLFTFGVPLLIAAATTLVTVWLVFRTPVVDNLNKKDFRLFRNTRRPSS